jgi:hypothetical protein
MTDDRIPPKGPATGRGIPPDNSRRDDDLTAAALRQALAHGQGGDKVNFSDPAAAPLGTDDEAAGTPPTQEQIRMAAAAELGPLRPKAAPQSRRTPADRAGHRFPGRLALWLTAMIVAVILVVLMLLGGQ